MTTANELIRQIVSKHQAVYNAGAPDWTGFGVSCWFGDGQDETVKYYYDSSGGIGKQMKTPSVYDEFEQLQALLPDPDSVHAVIVGYARDTDAVSMRIIRDAAEAKQYQNWLGNPFDISEAIRPSGV